MAHYEEEDFELATLRVGCPIHKDRLLETSSSLGRFLRMAGGDFKRRRRPSGSLFAL